MGNKIITNTFEYKREDGVNPETGFMSFQHFSGEKIYADIVVKPENKMTETERVECYPVSCDAEEISLEEGYYPQSSVVYIRALWKEFEPQQGVYNYEFIENILDKAKKCGQTLMFRLMPHSTRACDDVPCWLKEIMDCPERPEGKRVKDSPTDPEFMKLFCKAITKIGERFDKDPYFGGIDICLPGAWGEGHKLELYADDILEKTVDEYVKAFPNTLLVGQLGRPELVKRANKFAVTGYRGDGLGNPTHNEKLYPPRFEELGDLWKKVPVMFETYWWIGEWQRQGWDIDSIIEKTLGWHISSLNAKSISIPVEFKDKVEYWISKMGYHFKIDFFSCPEAVDKSGNVRFSLGIDNVGVAPCYKAYPLKVRFFGNGGEYVFDTGIDVRNWLPGKHVENIEFKLCDNIPKGEYDVDLFFETPTGQTVYFCTDAKRNNGCYTVGRLEIVG